jgi:predicted RNase H-like nuclease
MLRTMNTTVMGVDACKRGWVGVLLNEGSLDVLFARTIGELASQACEHAPIALVAIDIPIGLPDAGQRQADLLARRFVGPRSASVFSTPVRAALAEDDYKQAVLINQERADSRKISFQAFSLRTKIREVDEWLPVAGVRVVETHPEACFAAMAGSPLPYAKTTWAGTELRRHLLAQSGIELLPELGAAGREAAVDDVLDAAAAAWTAARVLAGTACSLPDPPEVFDDGLPAAIWY